MSPTQGLHSLVHQKPLQYSLIILQYATTKTDAGSTQVQKVGMLQSYTSKEQPPLTFCLILAEHLLSCHKYSLLEI